MFDKHTPWKKVYARYQSSKSLPMNEARMKAWSDRFWIRMDLPQVPSCHRSILFATFDNCWQVMIRFSRPFGIREVLLEGSTAVGIRCQGSPIDWGRFKTLLFYHNTFNCQKCLEVIGGNMWWYVAIDFSNFRTLAENWFGDSSPHPLKTRQRWCFRGCWKSSKVPRAKCVQGRCAKQRDGMVRVAAGGIGFQNQTPMGLSETQHGSCDPRNCNFWEIANMEHFSKCESVTEKAINNIDNIPLIFIRKLCSTVISRVPQMQRCRPFDLWVRQRPWCAMLRSGMQRSSSQRCGTCQLQRVVHCVEVFETKRFG